MNVKRFFEEEIREKKRTARGAGARKGGGGSRCGLPSDSLTRKQWEQRNGEVRTWNMDRPVTAAGLLSMPPAVRTRYLAGLAERYGAGLPEAAAMAGMTPEELEQLLGQETPRFRFPRRKQTEEQHRQWAAFLESGAEAAEAEECASSAAAGPRRKKRGGALKDGTGPENGIRGTQGEQSG